MYRGIPVRVEVEYGHDLKDYFSAKSNCGKKFTKVNLKLSILLF